jgi:epoxyqueuosine reductase
MTKQEALKKDIKAKAQGLGFSSIGFTSPENLGNAAEYFQEFLDNNYHGEMGWLKEKAERRKAPKKLWPEVNSIIMLSMNYGPACNPLDDLKKNDIGNISVYAKGKDYHDIIKKRLKEVARHIHRTYDADVKVFVDTAPVMEKPLAEKAGLGWQGKHTNLVSREFGSWLFIGSIFTTLKIDDDKKIYDHCGSCTACLNICPTNAFPEPYKLDARKCISYLTIEYKGHIDFQYREAMGNRIYGCDDCLSVCPWNKYAQMTSEIEFFPRIELNPARLDDLVKLDDESFRKIFAGSPIKRVGRDFFIRNVLIAIGNSHDKKYCSVLIERLDDESPYVRAMAVWALGKLTSEIEFKSYRKSYSPLESDPAVMKEWNTPFTG